MTYANIVLMAEPIGGRLSEVFRQTYEAAGLSQVDIAEALGVDQPTVSKWARGMRRPPLDALPIVERMAGLRAGTILRRAGYVDDGPCDVLAAIDADPDLDEEARTAIRIMYRVSVAAGRTAAPAG